MECKIKLTKTDLTQPPTRQKLGPRVNANCKFKNLFELKEKVFYGGASSSFRREAWLNIMTVYPFASSPESRTSISAKNSEKYMKYKEEWKKLVLESPKSHFIHENLFRIEKDVIRTDRALPFYPQSNNQDTLTASELIRKNPKLLQLRNILMTFTSTFPLGEPAFVQGMADLASTFLIVINCEQEAFWCFANFMNTFKSNFLNDGSGMRNQLTILKNLIKKLDPHLYTKLSSIDSLNLFCCFRWLLVLFRREFKFKDCLLLWDRILSKIDSFIPVFICFAILQVKRNLIINEIKDSDELLQFLNSIEIDAERVRNT
jgi:hypothetical protein